MIFVLFNSIPNLLDLPSPAMIEDCAEGPDFNRYKSYIEKSANIQSQFFKLSRRQRQDLISSFVKLSVAQQSGLRKLVDRTSTRGQRDYVLTKEMGMYDLTKIDFLLASQSKPTLFHSLGFVQYIYSMKGKNWFYKVTSSNLRLPVIWSHTGMPEYTYPSFVRFYEKRVDDLTKLVHSGFRQPYEEMTNPKLYWLMYGEVSSDKL